MYRASCFPVSLPKRIVPALLGGGIQYFDLCLHAAASMWIFGPLFAAPDASAQDVAPGLAVLFVAGPLGAVGFGHVGDRLGRKPALLASVLLAAGANVAIGLLPGYASIGGLAARALALLSFLHAVGLGATWAGAALLAVEAAPPSHRARRALAAQLGAPLGLIAAQVMLSLLSKEGNLRVPLLAGSVFVAAALWLWRGPPQAPASREYAPAGPLLELLQQHQRPLLVGTFSVACSAALIRGAGALGLNGGVVSFGSARGMMLGVISAALFLTPAILAAGWLSDRYTPRAVMRVGFALTIFVATLWVPVLRTGVLGVFIMLPLALVSLGLTYAPLAAFLPALFPARVRYTGVALAFSLGGVVNMVMTRTVGRSSIAMQLGVEGACLIATAVLGLAALQLQRDGASTQGLPMLE